MQDKLWIDNRYYLRKSTAKAFKLPFRA